MKTNPLRFLVLATSSTHFWKDKSYLTFQVSWFPFLWIQKVGRNVRGAVGCRWPQILQRAILFHRWIPEDRRFLFLPELWTLDSWCYKPDKGLQISIILHFSAFVALGVSIKQIQINEVFSQVRHWDTRGYLADWLRLPNNHPLLPDCQSHGQSREQRYRSWMSAAWSRTNGERMVLREFDWNFDIARKFGKMTSSCLNHRSLSIETKILVALEHRFTTLCHRRNSEVDPQVNTTDMNC